VCPVTIRRELLGENTVKMPREIVPMILNAWMPPIMRITQTIDGWVDRLVIGCVSEHGPPLMESSGISWGIRF